MSFYTRLSKLSVPTDRGTIEYRTYDRLSVDFIGQSLTRSFVYAQKVQRKPQLPKLSRDLRGQLTRRLLPTEI